MMCYSLCFIKPSIAQENHLNLTLRIPSNLIKLDTINNVILYLDIENQGSLKAKIFEHLELIDESIHGTSGIYFELYNRNQYGEIITHSYNYPPMLPLEIPKWIDLLPKKIYSYPIPFLFRTFDMMKPTKYRIVACYRIYNKKTNSYYLYRSNTLEISCN